MAIRRQTEQTINDLSFAQILFLSLDIEENGTELLAFIRARIDRELNDEGIPQSSSPNSSQVK